MLDETRPGWRERDTPPCAGLRGPRALRSSAWFIPHVDMITAWREHAETHADPLYGLHFAERWTLATMGPITHVVALAPTLGDAVAMYARVDRLLDSHNRTTLTVEGDTVVLRDAPPPGLGPWPRQLAESISGAFVHVVRQLTTGGLELREVGFMHERPAHADAVAAWFGAPVQWSQPTGRVVADAGILAAPMWSSSREAFASLQRTLVELQQRVLPGEAIVARVKAALHGEEEGPLLARSVGEVARVLGMSARTLQRRLGESGVSFRRLVDEVRAELLDSADSDKRLALAKRLGFADDSALRKFLRRAPWVRRVES
jgi:AraC-like DNA-binding protein